MTTKINCVTVQAQGTGKRKNHPVFYSEARYIGGKFAHQTRNRRTPLDAKVEMNNWCRKNDVSPVWRFG